MHDCTTGDHDDGRPRHARAARKQELCQGGIPPEAGQDALRIEYSCMYRSLLTCILLYRFPCMAVSGSVVSSCILVIYA